MRQQCLFSPFTPLYRDSGTLRTRCHLQNPIREQNKCLRIAKSSTRRDASIKFKLVLIRYSHGLAPPCRYRGLLARRIGVLRSLLQPLSANSSSTNSYCLAVIASASLWGKLNISFFRESRDATEKEAEALRRRRSSVATRKHTTNALAAYARTAAGIRLK